MDAESRRRIGRNESLFREVNEAIGRGLWPGEDDARVPFRCECGEVGCNRALEVAAADYERVRENPRRFLVTPGHEALEAEQVVEEHGGYLVVEKLGEAEAEARKRDPRD